MKKIVVTGTHGVGKTTLAHQICVTLKERNINTTIIEEKVRSCPFPINEKSTLDTEIWMIHTQIKAELHAKAELYDVAVLDRCSLDAIVYWEDLNKPKDSYFELLKKSALHWVQQYDLIVLVEPSSDTASFAVDAVRDSGINYRNRIRDAFRKKIDALPDHIHDKVLRVESDEVFNRDGHYSTAINKVIAHDAYPSSEYQPFFHEAGK
ncbi:MAG: ATP-binding protein [Chlamydiales bacterium]|nr:ATP-binding protein [Chlamydiales bacterium]